MFKIRDERRLRAGEVRVARDVLERVGFAHRAVHDGVFFGREAGEHDAEESDERDDVGAQDVLRVLVFLDRREVKWIDVVLGGEGYVEGAPARRFGELFVFAFGVNDDDIRPEHKRPEHFQLRRIALAGA